MEIGLLVSGDLGFSMLKFLHEKNEIECVFTDKNSISIIDYSEKKEIPLYIGNPRINPFNDFIKNIQVRLLLSINYLFIIPKKLIEFPSQYAINVHGSLLPKYRGRTPHVWAIINNEKHTGISAHLIEESCDTGGIIEQVEVEIKNTDTGFDLLRKFEEIYPDFVQGIIGKILEDGELNTYVQDDVAATYFEKRTPEDGQIDWSWQKNRVYNWIRALSSPYPGAYSFVNNKKVIINKADFSEIGFDQSQENGTVLKKEGEGYHIKSPNGALFIYSILTSDNLIIKEGDVLL